MRHHQSLLVVATIAIGSTGCATAPGVRYVYQDGDFGVVGMPENTDRWPTRYRTKADQLMDAHFPGGHEVVRAEEVVEGERTLKLEGSKTAEVAPQLPAAALNVAKVGRTASRSQSDSVKIKECRIIYRRSEGTDKSRGYADAALTPAQYVDPNAAGRLKAAEKPESKDWGDEEGPPTPDKSAGRPHAAG